MCHDRAQMCVFQRLRMGAHRRGHARIDVGTFARSVLLLLLIIIINSFKAQFQTAQCAMQLWNNTGAKILHAYMKLYNIQIYMKAKYNR